FLENHSLMSTLLHNSFFFNRTSPTEIYTLSLHDALPISEPRLPMAWIRLSGRPPSRQSGRSVHPAPHQPLPPGSQGELTVLIDGDRKSTRLNSSHVEISYAVFCLKKKNTLRIPRRTDTQS